MCIVKAARPYGNPKGREIVILNRLLVSVGRL